MDIYPKNRMYFYALFYTAEEFSQEKRFLDITYRINTLFRFSNITINKELVYFNPGPPITLNTERIKPLFAFFQSTPIRLNNEEIKDPNKIDEVSMIKIKRFKRYINETEYTQRTLKTFIQILDQTSWNKSPPLEGRYLCQSNSHISAANIKGASDDYSSMENTFAIIKHLNNPLHKQDNIRTLPPPPDNKA